MENNKTILIIKIESMYNVLRVAIDEIANGFIENGYNVEIFDASDNSIENFSQHAADILFNTKYDMFFSIQSAFSEATLFGIPLIDYIKKPYVGFIVDEPLYHLERLKSNFDTYHLAILDNYKKQVINTFYPNVKNVSILHHGGFATRGIVKPLMERNIDIFIPGGYKDPSILYDDLMSYDSDIQVFINEVIHNVLNNNSPNISLEVIDYFEKNETEISKNDFERISPIITKIDAYVRSYTRTKVIDALVESGLNVSVCGSGFSAYAKKYSNINIYSETGLDIEEVIEIMGNSKMVLNSLATFHGSHERIYTAMLQGAISVTNIMEDLEDEFIENEDYISYTYDKLDDLTTKLKSVLSDLDYAQKIADSAFFKAQNHTWEKRASEILDIAHMPKGGVDNE